MSRTISIITPTFNCEAAIERTLRSVKTQVDVELEHVVIDGASTDRTLSILASSMGDSLLFSEPDRGIYDALNKGLRKSTGPIVGLLHAGDQFAEDTTLRDVCDAFAAGSCDAVYGNVRFLNDSGDPVRYWDDPMPRRFALQAGWMPPHTALFLARDVHTRHGDYELGYRIAGDYEFIVRLLRAGDVRFAHLDRLLVEMSLGGVSTDPHIHAFMAKVGEEIRALRKNQAGFSYLTPIAKRVRKLSQINPLRRLLRK